MTITTLQPDMILQTFVLCYLRRLRVRCEQTHSEVAMLESGAVL